MHQAFRKNWNKTKFLILSLIIITFLLLVTVVYKSDEKINIKSKFIEKSTNSPDLKSIIKFLNNSRSFMRKTRGAKSNLKRFTIKNCVINYEKLLDRL